MKELLKDLNLEIGVKGCLILTRDGVVALSEIPPPLKADVVAAVASNAIQTANAALKEFGSELFSRFLINASYGKMIFVETGRSYLGVVLDKGINIDLTMLSISSTARRIKLMTA